MNAVVARRHLQSWRPNHLEHCVSNHYPNRYGMLGSDCSHACHQAFESHHT